MSRVSGGLHRFAFPMNGLWRLLAAPIFRKAVNIRRDTAGVTSLEYALIGFPFFGLVFATFQLGLWYFLTCSVDLGVYHAARQLMTGQIQALGSTDNALTPQTFTTGILCPLMPSFTSCSTSNVNVGLSVVSDFTQLVKVTPVTIPGPPTITYNQLTLKPLPQTYCTPKQGDVVYIQVQYKMPNIFGFFGLFHTTITSGTSVQIEQFPSTSGTYSNC
jgi:Flp pilus assembly protein TadG